MPNIASVLKEEIARLVRKELRGETEGLKKTSSRYRSEIASLKRRIEAQEKQIYRNDFSKALLDGRRDVVEPLDKLLALMAGGRPDSD